MRAGRRRRLLLARRNRTSWSAFPDDPGNADRADRACEQMDSFDRLGPNTRGAIAASRVDSDADRIERRFGGPYSEDERIAARVRADDDGFSGSFGPAFPKGI